MSETPADNLDFPHPPPQSIEATPAPAPPSWPHTSPQPARPAGALPGDRTISPISGGAVLGKNGKALAVLGLVAGCGVFLAATWTHPKGRRAPPRTEEPARQVVDWSSVKGASATPAALGATGSSAPSDTSTDAPTLAHPGAGAPSLNTAPDGQVVPALSVGVEGGSGADSTAGGAAARSGVDPKAQAAQQAAEAKAAKLQAIRAAPLVAYTAQERRPEGGAMEDALPGTGERPAQSAAASELDQLRRGSTLGLVRAQRLPDRNFLLTAGALLPCVLETALDTSSPGFVTCRITRDIYSDSGGVVLMEKGSRVIGEYRSGFQQGRARIFVLWDRITTPGGVAVEVSSPAADALGRAGFDGAIDSHFWRRFGGALLLTTVSGGISAAATADARFANVAQAPNAAAAAALENSISIPPTLTKPQGAQVAIFVSHDLDFSSVYALKER